MYLLSISTKEGGTQNKTHVLSHVLLLCTYSLSFLPSVTTSRAVVSSTLPSPFYNLASNYWYRNDVRMILPSFHWAKHIGWHVGNLSTRSVGGTSATQTPCELHLILCINPYKWTFPNCNISFIMDQSTNKTTNEWLLQVACGKTCPTLGALLFAWPKKHSVGCTKSKDQILLTDLVCFEVQCLPQSAHLKIFLILAFWWRRLKSAYPFLIKTFFTSASSCLLSSLLPSSFIIIYFSCIWRRQFSVESACVSLFPCVTLYRWIHFPSSVPSVLSTSPVLFTDSSEKQCFLSYSWNHNSSCCILVCDLSKVSTNHNEHVLVEPAWQNRVSKCAWESNIPVWMNFPQATLKCSKEC